MVGGRPLRVYGIVPEAWNDYKGNNSFFLAENVVTLQRQSSIPSRVRIPAIAVHQFR